MCLWVVGVVRVGEREVCCVFYLLSFEKNQG